MIYTVIFTHPKCLYAIHVPVDVSGTGRVFAMNEKATAVLAKDGIDVSMFTFSVAGDAPAKPREQLNIAAAMGAAPLCHPWARGRACRA